MSYTDQQHVAIELSNKPTKIVSLVPAQTELLADLGLENLIVGVTNLCVHPYYIKPQKEIVGSPKKIDVAKIKALKPDIILCNQDENSKEVITQCKTLATVHVSKIVTIDDVFELITQYGALFDCRTDSQKILQKIQFKLNDFQIFLKDKPLRKVAYFVWKDPWMVAANNTFINSILHLNKFQNIYKDKGDGFQVVLIKKIRLEGDPDVVFLPTEPFEFKEEQAFELGRFTHHAKTVFVEGDFFSWYGSRLLKSFEYFKQVHLRLD